MKPLRRSPQPGIASHADLTREASVGDYRKLEVWQRASVLADRVRDLVERLPRDERRRSADQLVRAADSIANNLAEGCGLNSDRQLARHTGLALGSANEVQTILDGFQRRKQLGERDADLPEEIRILRAQLANLQRAVSDSDRKRAKADGQPDGLHR